MGGGTGKGGNRKKGGEHIGSLNRRDTTARDLPVTKKRVKGCEKKFAAGEKVKGGGQCHTGGPSGVVVGGVKMGGAGGCRRELTLAVQRKRGHIPNTAKTGGGMEPGKIMVSWIN